MAETACPYCAYSPIPSGAEDCPRCHRRFVLDVREDSVVTATRLGGLTGAVTASPVPIAIALVLGAVAWFLRVLDVFTSLHDPVYLLAVPALLVAGAASVMAAAGPAKHLPAVLGLVCMAAVGLWLSPVPLHNVAFGAFGALILVATVSEPSSFRLKGGATLASIAAVVGLAALPLGTGKPREGSTLASISDERVGLRWDLPAGWRQAESLEGLHPEAPATRRAVLLATNGDGTGAFLVLDREPGDEPCTRLLVDVGAAVLKTPDEAPSPFPRGTTVLEIQGSAGAVRAACAVTPNGMLGIVVSSTGPASVVEATLRVLANGALVLADPKGP